PVRTGNAAWNQLQLDIFGELMDAAWLAYKSGISISPTSWNVFRTMMAHLGKIWSEPDEGIWEVRGGRQQFTHSKVMAWVAFDRAIKAVEMFGREGPVARWRGVRRAIHEDVCKRGFDPEIGSFVQFYGAKCVDASLL